jgi:hypothetical protein
MAVKTENGHLYYQSQYFGQVHPFPISEICPSYVPSKYVLDSRTFSGLEAVFSGGFPFQFPEDYTKVN